MTVRCRRVCSAMARHIISHGGSEGAESDYYHASAEAAGTVSCSGTKW